MKIFNRINDFVSRIRVERLEAEQTRQSANLDYVAMMTDVELPNEEEGVDDER